MIDNRYSTAQTILNSDKKRVQSSTIYPPITPQDGDVYIVTTYNDTLDNIAQAFYGDPALWWILAEANALGKGSLKVPAGIQLFIPNNFAKIEGDKAQLNP